MTLERKALERRDAAETRAAVADRLWLRISRLSPGIATGHATDSTSTYPLRELPGKEDRLFPGGSALRQLHDCTARADLGSSDRDSIQRIPTPWTVIQPLSQDSMASAACCRCRTGWPLSLSLVCLSDLGRTCLPCRTPSRCLSSS